MDFDLVGTGTQVQVLTVPGDDAHDQTSDPPQMTVSYLPMEVFSVPSSESTTTVISVTTRKRVPTCLISYF